MVGPPNPPPAGSIVSATADPLTWATEFLKERWPSGSVRPFIVRRLDAPDASVDQGDWILTYSMVPEGHLKRGQGNVEDTDYTFTIDIRTVDREACWAIKETILHGVLEPNRVFPHTDWTEWEWKVKPVTSYGTYNQIVIDVTLKKWKKRRTPNVTV